jgi:hypothetical protein
MKPHSRQLQIHLLRKQLHQTEGLTECPRCKVHYAPKKSVGRLLCRVHPGKCQVENGRYSCCGFNFNRTQSYLYLSPGMEGPTVADETGCLRIDHGVSLDEPESLVAIVRLYGVDPSVLPLATDAIHARILGWRDLRFHFANDRWRLSVSFATGKSDHWLSRFILGSGTGEEEDDMEAAIAEEERDEAAMLKRLILLLWVNSLADPLFYCAASAREGLTEEVLEVLYREDIVGYFNSILFEADAYMTTSARRSVSEGFAEIKQRRKSPLDDPTAGATLQERQQAVYLAMAERLDDLEDKQVYWIQERVAGFLKSSPQPPVIPFNLVKRCRGRLEESAVAANNRMNYFFNE